MNTDKAAVTARGEATRAALIEAAIEIFGRDGFDAASTRSIAEAAGANQALIGYHFGGKPGLYLAALEHIADRIGARMGPQAAAIEAELPEPSGGGSGLAPARALALLQALIGGFADMLTGKESAGWAGLVLREQQRPSAGFDLLYARVMQRLLGVMRRLIACARRTDPDSEATRLTALTLVGQVLVFRVAHAAVARQMGWQEVGPREIGAIKQRLQSNVAAILTEEERA